ncbi:MAG: hypothetical protein AB1488_10855 [Nitrospirota bacterium]
MENPSFVIGNIAKGKDLWNRHEEIKNIWKALETSSVLLTAPRRFGKTSIMYHLYENPMRDFKSFFLDTEGMGEPKDFLSALITKILSDSKIRSKVFSMAKWIKNIVGKIEEIEVADVRLKIKNERRPLLVQVSKTDAGVVTSTLGSWWFHRYRTHVRKSKNRH